MRFVKLSEISDLLNGYAFKSKNYVENGIRIIRIANVQEGYIADEHPCFYPFDSDEDIKKYYLFEGDILVSLTGNVGRVGIITSELLPAALNQRVSCIRLKNNAEVNSKFLFYYLRRKQFVLDCTKASKGVAQLNLSTKWLENYPVPLPNTVVQQRIVARIEELFSQLDSGVETLRKTKQQLAVYRQAVISNAYPDIPASQWYRLDAISEIIGGITKGRDLSGCEVIELPYLRVANVQNGYLDLRQMKTIQLKKSEKQHFLLQYGDVLFTEGGDRDKLGRGTIWRSEIEECVHQNHVFKARINSKLAIPEYVAFWSMSSFARNYFYSKGKQSVNLASINKSVLSALTLPLPDLLSQKIVVAEIESRLSVCDSIEQTVDAALQQAEALRQSILKEAFEGGYIN